MSFTNSEILNKKHVCQSVCSIFSNYKSLPGFATFENSGCDAVTAITSYIPETGRQPNSLGSKLTEFGKVNIVNWTQKRCPRTRISTPLATTRVSLSVFCRYFLLVVSSSTTQSAQSALKLMSQTIPQTSSACATNLLTSQKIIPNDSRNVSSFGKTAIVRLISFPDHPGSRWTVDR